MTALQPFIAAPGPWIWVAAAIALGIAQAALGAATLLWVALAALGTAATVALAPGLGLGLWAQLGTFAAYALLLVGFGRLLPAGRREARARRAASAALVGREAEAVAFAFHEGEVAIDGVVWPARIDGQAPTPRPGDRMRVVASDGRVVWVRPLDAG